MWLSTIQFHLFRIHHGLFLFRVFFLFLLFALCFFVTLSLRLNVSLSRNWKSNPNLAHCVQPLIHIKSISKIHRRRSAQNYNVKQIFADWINQCAYCFRLNIMYVYLSIYILLCQHWINSLAHSPILIHSFPHMHSEWDVEQFN